MGLTHTDATVVLRHIIATEAMGVAAQAHRVAIPIEVEGEGMTTTEITHQLGSKVWLMSLIV